MNRQYRIPTCTMAGAAGLLFAVTAVHAETLAVYTFEGGSLAAGDVAAGVLASDFAVHGAGVTSFPAGTGGGSSDAYSKTHWSDPDNYFHFSIAIEEGFIAQVTNLTFFGQRSDGGATNWLARYSPDNTTFHTLGAGNNGTAFRVAPEQCRNIQPVDLAGPVTFRIYGTNAADNSGTWRIDTVTLAGVVAIDTGIRHIRHQSYDGGHHDTWSATTNAGNGIVGRTQTNSPPSGVWALELVGSADKSAPGVTFDNVALNGASNVFVSVAFGARDVDADDDLFAAVSYDAGATWSSNKLVDGFNAYDLAFGSTGEVTRVPGVANPYVLAVPVAESQVRLAIRFKDGGASPANDRYFIDNVALRGIPEPAVAAPLIRAFGSPAAVTAGAAQLVGHVRGGYPYPEVTLYWGPRDGGSEATAWYGATALGVRTWGLVTNTLGGLPAGQKIYYRFHARNRQGGAWSPATSAFTTCAAALTAVRRTYLDCFAVATNPPMCIDRDGDGLADWWERETLGGTGALPGGDKDGDGASNLQEYLAGTDPDNASSHLRIAELDLAAPASTDVILRIGGGDHAVTSAFAGDEQSGRRYTIRAGNNDPAAAKAVIGSVADGGTGEHVFTDRGAAGAVGSRYYAVAVSYGGVAATNVEEWAMHVQPRGNNTRSLISVPVDYGSAENTFTGRLGEQLARGLSTGDSVRFWTADGAWVNCELDTQSGVRWTTNGVDVGVTVTPGMAMWVYRGSQPATRATAVFTGRSFSEADVAAFTFKTDGGGWTAFGWPLSHRRGHRSANPATDQTGFEALGTGGRASTTDKTLLGDEIWIWKDNTWVGFYSLLGHIGPGWDGRWWDNNRRQLADFDLEPGMAYYYRHRANWGGTDFNWRPELP